MTPNDPMNEMEQAICPYCLASMDWDRTRIRLTCNRCGESFIPTSVQEADAKASEPAEPASSVQTLLVPMLLAALMFVLVFGFGLYAIFRKPPAPLDPQAELATQTDASRSPATFPPKSLASLGYLPPLSEIVAVVQPAATNDFAKREQRDPAELMTKLGLPAEFLQVAEQLGLAWDDVAQIAAGFTLPEEGLFPRGVVVVLFRKAPADEAAFLKLWQAELLPGPNRYKASLRGVPIVIERPDQLTLLFSFFEEDLKLGVAPPGPGHFSTRLQSHIELLSPASLAWLALDEADWANKPLMKVVAQATNRADQLDPSLRAIVLGLSLEPGPVLRSAIKKTGAVGWDEQTTTID